MKKSPNLKSLRSLAKTRLYNLNLFAIGYEKDLASEIGQEPAFTEPSMPKPEGAQVSPGAEEMGMPEV